MYVHVLLYYEKYFQYRLTKAHIVVAFEDTTINEDTLFY
jgi:hypothetical protein